MQPAAAVPLCVWLSQLSPPLTPEPQGCPAVPAIGRASGSRCPGAQQSCLSPWSHRRFRAAWLSSAAPVPGGCRKGHSINSGLHCSTQNPQLQRHGTSMHGASPPHRDSPQASMCQQERHWCAAPKIHNQDIAARCPLPACHTPGFFLGREQQGQAQVPLAGGGDFAGSKQTSSSLSQSHCELELALKPSLSKGWSPRQEAAVLIGTESVREEPAVLPSPRPGFQHSAGADAVTASFSRNPFNKPSHGAKCVQREQLIALHYLCQAG